MRIKFPDQPEKFMESEIDLHEALQVSKKKQVLRKIIRMSLALVSLILQPHYLLVKLEKLKPLDFFVGIKRSCYSARPISFTGGVEVCELLIGTAVT